ncbi:FAD-binding and (Fe-S)-binding domain-containing protein [Saxibacter everestensis]|uniref:FAD-binding and (Fe-S)-binding domain-containing protein n=1 Tax=Saxibacter everestensis TaxID=2909229 RepID=A0ABY8QYY5_9MICO|nr:FAD-binding and (Fe-S)-binding domain-containing protein [Brevibacteriaceae bacterium ZFBP1038]
MLRALRATGVDVDTAPRRLAEYSYDASNYRVPPLAVIFPRDADSVATIVRLCHRHGVPVIGRGGGTSMAGNAVGPGIVLDFSRYMTGISDFDPEGREVIAQPGIVLTTLQRRIEQLSDGELTFAPDPSSKTRATVGGAVSNDACGNHSVRHGRTSDHVIALDVVTVDGFRLTATSSGLSASDPADRPAVERAAELEAELRELTTQHMSDFRTELGRIPRQVSGFHLGHLLPENGFNVARALVGSEGTCVIVVGARLRLVAKEKAALLVSLGYPDVVEAARDIMTILEFKPAAIEGIDEAIVDTMRFRRGHDSVRGLPDGRAWLYVDLDGDNADAVAAEADRLLARLKENGRLIEGMTVPDPDDRASLWRVREEGAGLASRLVGGGESWPGWEDSAVAPENLADYLDEFRTLLSDFELHGVMYGHLGAGCMHIRITFDLRSDQGRRVMQDFMRAAAKLVVKHGGSLSGEHGDGRARSELLPIMYSPAMLSAFARFKRIWDPQGVLNPGSLVDPDGLGENLALEGIPDREWRTSFDLKPVNAPVEGKTPSGAVDSFVHAVQGCVGIGKCRTDTGGVMCPSFRATRDEKDSTRGRARVLQEMVRSSPSVAEGWKSEEVREALDLCLSCKACSTDCPVGVDMATYKSEFFDHYYEGRRRPMSHYSLGWLPRWLRVTERVAPLVNAVMATPLGAIGAKLGGLTTKRPLPKFASRRAVDQELLRARDAVPGKSGVADVVLLVDTFTRGFRPRVAGAAQRVLGDAGQSVECRKDACCGLTWISTGQLGTAKKLMSKAIGALDDGTDRPIVVIEPSCAAAFRKDAPELLGTDASRRVAARITSFAGMVTKLSGSGWTPSWPDGTAPEAVTVQTHCHEYSTFGAATQKAALKGIGVPEVREATGCCGVAGNFGFESEHFDISMQVAEQSLAPALRASHPETPVLTDGFSCQMQVKQLDPDRPSLHLAELLDPDPTAEPT